MARAIQLARGGLYGTHPNPRVGCVLVKEERIISEGWHIKAGEAHAEINAIQNANESTVGATCYVSLEPCCVHGKTPPCTEAIQEAGIVKVIAAMEDPNPEVSGRGIEFLNTQNINAETGLLSAQAETLNPGFNKRMRKGMPYVRCKLAMSLDGKVALANGISQWITSPQSRHDVQKLRAASSAILTGIGTVIGDNPSLNVRDIDTRGRQPIRVVLDSYLRTAESARMLALEGETIIFTISEDQQAQETLRKAGAKVVILGKDKGRVNLTETLQYLANEKQVNEILIEAGPELAGAMISENLVDELIIYKAPIILGDKAASMLLLDEFQSMDESISLELIDSRSIGVDEKLTFKINRQCSAA